MAGNDGTNPFLLKHTSYFASALTYLCNFSINKGIFSSKLKIALLRPIFKQGNDNELNNYGPFNLLSVFPKTFEVIINNKLINFFLKNNLLSKYQHGFISSKVTDTAIYNITKTIYLS